MAEPLHDIVQPNDPSISARIVFLHVGQGDSTLALAKDGDRYLTMLVDINRDEKAGGIDVPRLVSDLVGDSGLDIFVNTHPHNDHLRGITELKERVRIGEVWHSGHVPGPDDREAYDELQSVIASVEEDGGTETELCGSRSATQIGDVECYVLAPAEHVKDEVEDEEPAERRRRIHEQCVVLRIGKAAAWVMLTGDADREAWEKHITRYQADRLPSQVLSAPHHGSKSFFYKPDDDDLDDPYTEALDEISPEYVIVSAPRRAESRHGHPHAEALELYEDRVGADQVLHTGAKRHSFICDLYDDGTYQIHSDQGALAELYPAKAGKADDDELHESAQKLQRVIRPGPLGHVEPLRWPARLSEKVRVDAYLYLGGPKTPKDRRIPHGGLNSDGRQLRPNQWIKFIALSRVLKQCQVFWQVVNTGEHARHENGLRGEIFKGSRIHWESTLYTGQHWIECFLVRDGTCVARSGRFLVNIKNPVF